MLLDLALGHVLDGVHPVRHDKGSDELHYHVSQRLGPPGGNAPGQMLPQVYAEAASNVRLVLWAVGLAVCRHAAVDRGDQAAKVEDGRKVWDCGRAHAAALPSQIPSGV